MSILKGWFGEKKTILSMWLSLNKKVYKRFHDVIIPASNGTTQIDHLLVSQYGIFIVETKNKAGWIFGSKEQAKWTQTFHRKKYSFQNPLKQTFRQQKVLAEFLSISDFKIHVVIYFVGKCKFKTQLPSNVIRSSLGRYIKAFDKKCLSEEEVQSIVVKLNQHKVESNITNKDHIRSLKERLDSKTVCPNCGSDLITKVAKKGPKSGEKFLGCKSYPKCRFTKNI